MRDDVARAAELMPLAGDLALPSGDQPAKAIPILFWLHPYPDDLALQRQARHFPQSTRSTELARACASVRESMRARAAQRGAARATHRCAELAAGAELIAEPVATAAMAGYRPGMPMHLQGSPVAAAAAVAAVGLPLDLRKRIETMAEHVVRQGIAFENGMKQKNLGNPLFAFLIGGEGAEYYAQLLQAHQAAQRPQGSGVVAPVAPGAAGTVVLPPNGPLAELSELLQRWREPTHVVALHPDMDRQLAELFAALEHVASRDAIRNGRLWIEANVAMAQVVAGNIMKKTMLLPKSSHRLHILFLLHDAFQNEAAAKPEGSRPLMLAMKPFLPWILRPSYLLASGQGGAEEAGKVLKLLRMWGERGVLPPRETEEIRLIVSAAPELFAHAQRAHQQPLQPGQVRPGMPHPPGAVVTPGYVRPGFPPGAAPGMVAPGGCGVPLAVGLQGQGGQLLAPRGGQTPESVPVGLMASMLKQVSRRGKDMHTAFVPYRPLDPNFTPQALPVLGPPSDFLLKRLQEFYDAAGDGAKAPGAGATRAPPAAVAAGAAVPPPPDLSGASAAGPGRPRSRSRSGERMAAAMAAEAAAAAGARASTAL
eukprot:TRINITY_DN37513_c0_g1_i1.p2 TRINITY_DN37513_c0_g1~~TRINITY_DN37513_c0_g1_i1.p2  ORF type:complete len:595 (-),score=130.71 TRINITY_DN37513_c0_g1_i1:304-2088(-)